MTVPYTFASAVDPLPLSELDANFATAITLGSSAMILGGTYTTISGLNLNSANISGNFTGTATGTFATNNFSIKESGGKLYFYYQSTPIASLDSSGNFTALTTKAGATP